MVSNLVWSKYGENHRRVYKSRGRRAAYQIGLDPVEDRWVLYVNSVRSVDDFYFVANAQRMADAFEAHGMFAIPADMRPRPDHGEPHILNRVPGQPLFSTGGSVAALLDDTPRSKRSPRGKLPVPKPNIDILTDKLHRLVTTAGITPMPKDAPWGQWKSGVYALIDCVFSARSHYEFVVLPLLDRLSARPGLSDDAGLVFSAFPADVDLFGEDKLGRYADEVLTRNKLSGRLKVEICYEACEFFAERNLETIADLRATEVPLEELILEDFQATVRGIGPSLSHHLLTLFGYEDHVKVDAMITRFWGRMGDWVPRRAHEADHQVILNTFREVAARMGTTPARLDNAIWRYENNHGN